MPKPNNNGNGNHNKKVSINYIRKKYQRGEPLSVITAYDFPTAQMVDRLSRQFGNGPRAWGMRGPEQIMQVWTASDGDWTLVVRYASGTSCIVAMGENWESHQAKSPA